MITHDEARELASKALLYGLEEVENDKLVRYISQQEKKDELLGLYQEKDKLVYSLQSYTDRIDGGYRVDINEWHREENRLDAVYKLIETIEKEFGEMK